MANQGKVFFKQEQVGHIAKETDGAFIFQYRNENVPSISLTLPTSKQSYESEELFPFFDGLIPEGWLLDLASKNWKIPKDDRMALLLSTCFDCVGAVSVKGSQVATARSKTKMKDTKLLPVVRDSDRCLSCLQNLDSTTDFYHPKCAKELFGLSHAPFVDVVQNDLEDLALLQLNQRLTLTGVQRKLSLSMESRDSKSGQKERLTIVGLDGQFILKPATVEFPEMPMVEHISMKIAELHGLKMAKCGLVFLASGEQAYITKRFDRLDDQKVPVEDFCQLSRQMTAKKYSSSSEKMGKVIDEFSTAPGDDKVSLFQAILFSFWIGNADMHLKNFSLWKEPDTGFIRLSPGYDYLSTRLLISTKEDNEELALPVNGKKNKIRWKDFESLAESLKIPAKVAVRLKDRMLDLFPNTQELIYRSFLSEETKDRFVDLLENRSKLLE